MESGTIGKVLGGCGALLVILCGLSALFWGFHVFVDPRGAISDDEAAPGMLGSCCCAFISLAIAVVGGVLAARAKKKPNPPV